MAPPAPARADIPTIEPETQAYWDAAREGRLTIARCGNCGRVHHYPRPFCPFCWSEDVHQQDASGNATLYTYSIVFRNDLPPFGERIPYVAAVVDLAEGPRLMTNIVDCDPQTLEVGMPLRVVFQPVTDEITAPFFTPAP